MQTSSVVISGTGLWTPSESVTNEELVTAYNAYVKKFNGENASDITAGKIPALAPSSAEFIEKASGIKSRFVYKKDGILDVNRMRPRIPLRSENDLSDQAEMALAAARPAMAAANKTAADIDMVIVSCAYTQRSYPAIAIEVQGALGIEGFGFDMLVACSAATFALQRAHDAVAAGSAKCVLVINPELTTPQVNFCSRDSHFIFGDVATASIVESAQTSTSEHSFEVLGTKAVTTYSNNIRSNFGFVANANDVDAFSAENMFHQDGRKIFKEVCPMAVRHISGQLEGLGFGVTDVKRWFLHQANINMNTLIAKKLLGRPATPEEAPIVLDRYANTASAGSIITFHLHNKDFESGDIGLICSFGAGYSIGSLVVRKQ